MGRIIWEAIEQVRLAPKKTTFWIKCQTFNASITTLKYLTNSPYVNAAHVWRLSEIWKDLQYIFQAA